MNHRTEYAGFRYVVTDHGETQTIDPEPGQHVAANKEKHRQAALQEWRRDIHERKHHGTTRA
jgi:hypothetical protein